MATEDDLDRLLANVKRGRELAERAEKAHASDKLVDAFAQSHVEAERARIAAGLMGRFFGNRHHAPIFIAGAISIALTLTIIVVVLARPHGSDPLPLIQALGAFLTLALGYVFGKAGS